MYVYVSECTIGWVSGCVSVCESKRLSDCVIYASVCICICVSVSI